MKKNLTTHDPETLDIIEGLVRLCVARETEIADLASEIVRLNAILAQNSISHDKLVRRGKKSTLRSAKVLICDPNKKTRDGLRNILRNEGYIVSAETGTARGLLSAFDEFSPDIVIMDVDLPDMDGADVLVRLRRIDESVKIIVLSKSLNNRDLLKIIKSGASDFVSKPFSPYRILSTLSKHSA